VILSRRSLLASLGLALPVVAVATAAKAATVHHPIHPAAKRHLHASSHVPHHRKPHRTAAAARPASQA
jgi:type IV secretory pathway TrbD component